MKKKSSIFTILLLVLIFAFSVPASAAENKGIRVFTKPIGVTLGTELPDYLSDRNHYCIYTTLLTNSASKTKLLKTNTYSGKLYIPKSFLSFNDCEVDFSLAAWFTDKISKGYYGLLNSRQFYTVAKQNGKLVTYYYDEADKKDHNASSVMSVKKSGDYYLVTFNKMKSASTYIDCSGDTPLENQTINTKTPYYLELAMDINIRVPQTVKGYIYVDQLTVNAAKKLTVTYNSKDYKKVNSVLDEHDLYTPVVKIGS